MRWLNPCFAAAVFYVIPLTSISIFPYKVALRFCPDVCFTMFFFWAYGFLSWCLSYLGQGTFTYFCPDVFFTMNPACPLFFFHDVSATWLTAFWYGVVCAGLSNVGVQPLRCSRGVDFKRLRVLAQLLFRHVQQSRGWWGSTVKNWCFFHVNVSQVIYSRELALPNVYQA